MLMIDLLLIMLMIDLLLITIMHDYCLFSTHLDLENKFDMIDCTAIEMVDVDLDP